MLLVAGWLEAADLDQRKFPRSPLPGTALAGAPLACGRTPDAPLLDPRRMPLAASIGCGRLPRSACRTTRFGSPSPP